MNSMPPATITPASPSAIRSCASIAAFIPDPHILLTVVAGTLSGSPAWNAAWRAGACPCPAGRTQPISTSPGAPGTIPASATAAAMAAPPSAGAGRLAKTPWNAPIALRRAPTITTSAMPPPFHRLVRHGA